MNTRTIRYLTAMFGLLIAFVICIVCGYENEVRPICGCFCLVSYVYWTPEETKNKPPLKGTIQFDKRNYDVPAMRIVFDGDPIKIINYDEVRFKVDRNADLRELDE